MTAQRLIVRVRPDGTVQAETEGVTGIACLDYISLLEQLVLGEAVSSEFTADYQRVEDQAGVIGVAQQLPDTLQEVQVQEGVG